MEFRLQSGEAVINRPNSHLHEDGVGQFLAEVLQRISALDRPFIEAEVEFPRPIGKTICVETVPGDEIVFAQRPNRAGPTRFVKKRDAVDCNFVAVALKKGNQGQCPGPYYVLLTAYVGRITPAEPWNERDFLARPDPAAARQNSRAFWENHALVYGLEPIVPGTETTNRPW